MSQRSEEKITEKTTVAEILDHPGAMEVLAKYRLPCLHCPMATFEIGSLKIGEVARTYGINATDLINELNQQMESQKSEESGK